MQLAQYFRSLTQRHFPGITKSPGIFSGAIPRIVTLAEAIYQEKLGYFAGEVCTVFESATEDIYCGTSQEKYTAQDVC